MAGQGDDPESLPACGGGAGTDGEKGKGKGGEQSRAAVRPISLHLGSALYSISQRVHGRQRAEEATIFLRVLTPP